MITATTSPAPKKPTAAGLYASNECRELFKRAWKRFPRYNTSQSDQAADFIFDNLLPLPEGADDEMDQEQKDELYEMIYAGLT